MHLKILLTLCLFFISSTFFIKTAPTYNQTLSKILVRYAAMAFCPSECLESWTCGTTKQVPSLIDVSYLTSNLTKAVVYVGYDYENQQIITSWRGSSNTRNWIEDFTTETQEYKCENCRIHVGFYFDYLSLEKKLIKKTNQLISKYEVRKITCTGHSLGGSLSTINGIEFVDLYGKNIEINVHNYGSPRIGNVALAHHIHKKVPLFHRVVHNRDSAPHFPTEAYGYWHTAYEIFFNAQMTEYKICNDSGEDKTCSNKFFPHFTFDDHDFYFIHISQVKC